MGSDLTEFTFQPQNLESIHINSVSIKKQSKIQANVGKWKDGMFHQMNLHGRIRADDLIKNRMHTNPEDF